MNSNPHEFINNFREYINNSKSYLNPRDLYLAHLIYCYLNRMEDCFGSFADEKFNTENEILMQLVNLSIVRECIKSLDDYFLFKKLQKKSFCLLKSNLFKSIRSAFPSLKTNNDCFDVIRGLVFAHPLSVDDRIDKGQQNRKNTWHNICSPYIGRLEKNNGYSCFPIAYFKKDASQIIETVYVNSNDLISYLKDLFFEIQSQISFIKDMIDNGSI